MVIVNDDTRPDIESWTEFLKTSDLTGESFHGHSMRFYANALFEPHYADVFTRYFDALAKQPEEGGDRPMLVHCMGGKDRTGMLCALTHTLLGVHKDDVIADFLLTNDEARFEREGPYFQAFIQEELGRAPTLEALRVAMGVEAAWLEAAFASAIEKCGSVEGYLEKGLGVNAAKREAIEARLLT